MEFALSTPQLIACLLVGGASAVLVQWGFRWADRRRTPTKVTIRVIGTAVVAEPGDLLTIALNGPVDDEYYNHLVDQLHPLKEMGIKVGIVEDAAGVAVSRGRADA